MSGESGIALWSLMETWGDCLLIYPVEIFKHELDDLCCATRVRDIKHAYRVRSDNLC